MLIYIIIFLASPLVWAEDIYFNIKQSQSVAEIQAGLQAAIDNATSSDRIIVTGSKTDADIGLYIDIGSKTVIWKATYQSSASIASSELIVIEYSCFNGIFEVAGGTLIATNCNTIVTTGTVSYQNIIVSGNGIVKTSGNGFHAIRTAGNVEIKDNAQVSGTNGEVIATEGENSIVSVSGGSVTAASENAIITQGKNAKVFVSGGYVGNDAKNSGNNYYPVIFMRNESNNALNLIISGTAIVEAKGRGCAIYTYGSVEVKGNAQVRNSAPVCNSDNIAICFNGYGDITLTVAIMDNAIITGNYEGIHSAGNGRGRVLLSGMSKVTGYVRAFTVELKDDAQVINENSGCAIQAVDVVVSNSCKVISKQSEAILAVNVEIKDNAQVILTHGYYYDETWYKRTAISTGGDNPSVMLSGGVVFAPTGDISEVIKCSNFTGPVDTGILMAWDKASGNTAYEMNSTVDILKLPESATAYWDKKDGNSGITYANGENKGFIPLEDVSVLSIKESILSNLNLFPNPVSNILHIETGNNNPIPEVKIYSIQGVLLIQTKGNQVDISMLARGIYMAEVEGVCKKVVKQ